MSKLVIVGLDAGSFNIIDAMTGEELPFLKGLIKNGVRAGLKSIYPAITPPAWTSLYTGVNPGKHGIFSFIEDTNTLVNSTINKYPYFWDF
ncbi:MAG TPA: alkaline phosphatase family protein, partial [Candidatus Hypogeohydataceae bacterium YC40]